MKTFNHLPKEKRPVEIFQLFNKNGIKTSFLSIGASIYKVLVPQTNGLKNIILSFKNMEDYWHNNLYLGTTLGPTAGRIAKGKLPINNNVYSLDCNDGDNHLHGGQHNVSFQNWKVIKKSTQSITFSTFVEDGLDGYPGNRVIYVTYTLDDNNKLTIFYEAYTDKNTYFNLSNHTYFNLDDYGENAALAHKVYMDAQSYVQNNQYHLPVGLSNVKNTPFDFNEGKILHEQLETYKENEQISLAKGYNHAFVLNQERESLTFPCASISHPNSKIQVNIFTDAPSIVLYSGGFIDDSYELDNGVSSASCGIALEAQEIPNAANHQQFQYTITKAGGVFRRTICYEIVY